MASNATASATHSGRASVSRWRTSPSPGASSSTSPTTTNTATIWSVRLASVRGSNSSGIVTGPSAAFCASRASGVSQSVHFPCAS